MLAIAQRGIDGRHYDAAREQVVERVGEGDEPWIAGCRGRSRRGRSASSRRALDDAAERRPRAVRPGRHPAGDRAPTRGGAGGEVLRDLGVYIRAAARAARDVAAAAAASPPPFSCTSSAAARAAASARSIPTSGVAADRALRRAPLAAAASSAASAASSAIRSGSSIVQLHGRRPSACARNSRSGVRRPAPASGRRRSADGPRPLGEVGAADGARGQDRRAERPARSCCAIARPAASVRRARRCGPSRRCRR